VEIKVPKAELKSAVSAAKKALSKIVIQEERGHLLFEVAGDTLTVLATNNDLKALCKVAVENVSQKDFSFTVDPKILEKLIVKIDTDVVRMSFNQPDLVLKVFTTDSDKSFSSLQSFPPDRMLTFDTVPSPDRVTHIVDKEVLKFALGYAGSFLAAPKEDQKQFDFVVIDKGIVYAANGSNKMGFIVFKAFEKIENFKIRKSVLSVFKSFAEGLPGDSVVLTETKKSIGIESSDGNMYYSCLKSNTDPTNVPREHIKSEGPYVKIDKNRLIKVLDRLMVSGTTISTSGVELVVTGQGESACLEINLISSLKVTENFSCERVNDANVESVSHVVDYKIFKSVLGAFTTDKEVRLHINDANRFYKVYNSGEINGNKYILAGIGSYAKVIKQ
jgi:hypothetical protein